MDQEFGEQLVDDIDGVVFHWDIARNIVSRVSGENYLKLETSLDAAHYPSMVSIHEGTQLVTCPGFFILPT